MKGTVVTQWVKVPPGQRLATRPVATPAGNPGNRRPKPGGARVQAASLSPEMCIVVDTGITARLGSGNADAVSGAEGSSPGRVKASIQDSTGVEERGMHSQGAPGNLGEPPVSLLGMPEEQGYRLTKSPGVGGELPTASEPTWETQTKGADKVLGSEREAKRPERDRGQS